MCQAEVQGQEDLSLLLRWGQPGLLGAWDLGVLGGPICPLLWCWGCSAPRSPACERRGPSQP